jgi:hypothetical protein
MAGGTAVVTRIYRLDIEYPEGSQEWGWEPEDYDGEIPGSYETAPFRWPAERLYLSRSGASQRAKLLRGWGAKVTVLPSLPVEWPAGAEGEP